MQRQPEEPVHYCKPDTCGPSPAFRQNLLSRRNIDVGSDYNPVIGIGFPHFPVENLHGFLRGDLKADDDIEEAEVLNEEVNDAPLIETPDSPAED